MDGEFDDLRSLAHELGTALLVQNLYQLGPGDLASCFIWNVGKKQSWDTSSIDSKEKSVFFMYSGLIIQ